MKSTVRTLVVSTLLLLALMRAGGAYAAIGACGSDPTFSFVTRGWHLYIGNVTWSESGITDPAYLSAVNIVIHLPVGSFDEQYSAPNGETVSFVNDQAAGVSYAELEVVPASGYSCSESGSFTVNTSTVALSGGSCGTWDPATIPHFD